MAVLGQASYSTLGEAEAENWEEQAIDNFPVVEFRPLFKVIYLCDDSFTNSVNAAVS